VEVDVAVAWEVEHPLGDDAAVGYDDDGLGANVLELLAEFEVVLDFLGLQDGDIVFEGCLFYGWDLEFHASACGSVGLGEDEGYFVACSEDGFEGGNGELRGSAED
jgi:hypothetical protein